MFQHVIIGQYVSGDSIVHRLDARAKIMTTFWFVVIVFLANNFVSYLFLFLTAILAIFLSKINLIYVYKGLRPVFLLVLIMFLVHGFYTKEGEVLFSIGSVAIYSGGITQGAFIASRLLLLIMMTTILTLTTSPITLTDGLETLFSPLSKVKVPVHEIALMMSISLRFIPTLLQETEKIVKAQSARGANFTEGTIFKRAKAVIPLLVPLFIQSFKRAEDLAIAMEARGYRGGEGRTKYRELTWKAKDTFLIVYMILLALLLLFTRK
ncbi:MAG: energy-coupling factor transporter transmembrane protein EcfT [Bacillaceae bacterium]|nr:energy-coupling factor transporter transmembrane protein EcfT [Bacillaceae bacterium]